MRPSASENFVGLRRGLRPRSSRRPGEGTHAPAGPGTRALPPGRPGCASNRARERLPAGPRGRSVPRPSPYSFVDRSSVASRTASQRARVLNLVFGNQFAADLFLIASGLVTHGGDELARSYVFFGVSMAVETPLHLQRVHLVGERHAVHSAVAGLAAHTLVDMNAVVEIDEIGQVVDARPTNRLIGAETRAHRFQRGTGAPDLRVAVHACLGGWNIGETGGFHRGVAIPAVHTQAAHVVRVAERHGLLAGLRRPRGVVRPAQPVDGPDGKSQNKHGAKDGDAREGIGAVAKDLGHGLPVPPVKRQECIISHREKTATQFSFPKESLFRTPHLHDAATKNLSSFYRIAVTPHNTRRCVRSDFATWCAEAG